MHRWQHRLDADSTELRHFISANSYVSFRIHPGSRPEHQCQYLAGNDAEMMRRQVFDREKYRCYWCGKKVPFDHPSIYVRGHLCHVGGNTKVERCWCPEALHVGCYDCHIVNGHSREIRSAKT